MATAGAKERLVGDARLLANDLQRLEAPGVDATGIGLLDGCGGDQLLSSELPRFVAGVWPFSFACPYGAALCFARKAAVSSKNWSKAGVPSMSTWLLPGSSTNIAPLE